MTEEEIDKMADNFVNTQDFTRVYSVARKAECGAFWKYGFLAGLKADKPKWYKLSEKYPEADKLVRVRLMSGMEHICETCYYEPTEDEIGYGKLVITFYELNGEWVDDNDIIAWCEIPKYTEE